jgi:hypothetical protein
MLASSVDWGRLTAYPIKHRLRRQQGKACSSYATLWFVTRGHPAATVTRPSRRRERMKLHAGRWLDRSVSRPGASGGLLGHSFVRHCASVSSDGGRCAGDTASGSSGVVLLSGQMFSVGRQSQNTFPWIIYTRRAGLPLPFSRQMRATGTSQLGHPSTTPAIFTTKPRLARLLP